jgi:hypothetical protein
MESPPSTGGNRIPRQVEALRVANVGSSVDLKRLFLRALVASLSVTAGLAILTLLFGEVDDTAGQILATTAFLSLYSLLLIPAGVLFDRRRAVPLASATVGLAVGGFVNAMIVVWGTEDAWKGVVSLTAFAGACAQAAALTARRRADESGRVRQLYVASLVLGFGLATLITVAALLEIDEGGYYRGLGAVAVANVLASLLQPILRRMGRTGEAGVRLVFWVDRGPSAEAVAAARGALEKHGVKGGARGRLSQSRVPGRPSHSAGCPVTRTIWSKWRS